MILQCHTIFDQLAELNPSLPSIRFLSLKDHPELKASIAGTFSIINAMMMSLHRIDGVLYFRSGNQEFEITDDIRSTLETRRKYRKFRLLKGNNLLVDVKYLTPKFQRLSFDPTPFVEEEDFDFLLFVHNVLTEPGRRSRVCNQ